MSTWNFSLGSRSLGNLVDVHPDLVKVVIRGLEISSIDFSVIEGRRTQERQRKLYETGASRTLNSRHITGHAVDIVPYVAGEGVDWYNIARFRQVGHAMRVAALELDIDMEWGAKTHHGGSWTTFNDMPHFQLSRRKYS